MGHKKLIIPVLAYLLFATFASVAAQTSGTPAVTKLPKPILYLTGMEYYSAGGKDWTRYRYAVDNSSAYPDTLFAAAPTLPPCGTNTNSSRSWVDFFDSRGKRLYGFCSLSKASELNGIWFAVETGEVPPSYVYIEIHDRQANLKYKSNLADTVE